MRVLIGHALAGLVLSLIPSVLATPLDPRLLQKPKTPIDNTTYANIVKYASYPTAANALSGPSPGTGCALPPYSSVIERFINASDTDTQVAVFRSAADREIVVGVPGTSSQQDYATDFTFLPVPYLSAPLPESLLGCGVGCLVHLGFLGAWNSVAEETTAALADLRTRYPDYGIVVVGTSLGGALAQLAFAAFRAKGWEVKAAYTYGQPRVGNVAFANYIDRLAGASDKEVGIYHRVTHSDDGVPQLPPILLGGFWHPRTEYWQSTDRPSLETIFRCFGQEPADCNNQAGGFGINAAHGGYAGGRYDCASGVASTRPTGSG